MKIGVLDLKKRVVESQHFLYGQSQHFLYGQSQHFLIDNQS